MQRNQSLDALRGFAILTMVLSGSIAFGGVLPAWMYHAQVPPPLHKFDPSIHGITWVDLVFPFFLFSMGAAIPLSLARMMKERSHFLPVLWIATRRLLLLTFFALFILHMRAWVISETPGSSDYVLSLVAFVLLFFQFYETGNHAQRKFFQGLKLLSFAIAVLLLYYLPFGGKGFLFEKSDIIILVLGNMAFFGTIIWWFTKHHPLLRLGILPFIMAIFLGGKEAGSWNEVILNFSPLPWMYKFYYLKYLFIVIPGTFAGEWMLRQTQHKTMVPSAKEHAFGAVIATIALSLVVINTALLFQRHLVLNMGVTLLLVLLLGCLLYNINKRHNLLLNRFFRAGTYLLLLGLFFEAYEGGIRKDTSTYSYYFVTSGLAFFMLIGFYSMQMIGAANGVMQYLSLNGRNPMVAYVAGSLLLIPVLHLSGWITYFNAMNSNPWLGFAKGIIFTGVVSLVTIFFTRRNWFWKT